MCASIQKGYEVDSSEPLISMFSRIFDQLQERFPGRTRMEIADTIVAAKNRIDTTTTAQKTLLDIAVDIYNSVYVESIGVMSLEETAAAYITILRQAGE